MSGMGASFLGRHLEGLRLYLSLGSEGWLNPQVASVPVTPVTDLATKSDSGWAGSDTELTCKGGCAGDSSRLESQHGPD